MCIRDRCSTPAAAKTWSTSAVRQSGCTLYSSMSFSGPCSYGREIGTQSIRVRVCTAAAAILCLYYCCCSIASPRAFTGETLVSVSVYVCLLFLHQTSRRQNSWTITEEERERERERERNYGRGFLLFGCLSVCHYIRARS